LSKAKLALKNGTVGSDQGIKHELEIQVGNESIIRLRIHGDSFGYAPAVSHLSRVAVPTETGAKLRSKKWAF
jgi:hypothetical protein